MKKFHSFGIFLMIFGLVLGGCDNGTSPDDKEQLESGYYGEILNLSGQIYEENGTQYKGTHGLVTFEDDGSGTITNGKLNFLIGVPDNLQPIDKIFSVERSNI